MGSFFIEENKFQTKQGSQDTICTYNLIQVTGNYEKLIQSRISLAKVHMHAREAWYACRIVGAVLLVTQGFVLFCLKFFEIFTWQP